jgi:hypothetical protein
VVERAGPHRALAIHICADVLTTEPHRQWPPWVAARDTIERTARMCQRAGIAEQYTLAGDTATCDDVLDALTATALILADDGLLVLTFSGHTERGDGPPATARWCFADGALSVAELAAQLAHLPAGARIVVIADTGSATAIRHAVRGPQPFLLIAGCDDHQTMTERLPSEFVYRLEQLLLRRPEPSLTDLRAVLEADTPDSERPVVWTNTADDGSVFTAGRSPAARRPR